jgi:phenylalanyl-tRNA synthetase alpha chain
MSEESDRNPIDDLLEKASAAIMSAKDLDSLERERVRFLGRKGAITTLLRSIGELPKEQRPSFGDSVNELKERIQKLYGRRRSLLSAGIGEDDYYQDDPSLPGRRMISGGRHVLHKVLSELRDIFFGMGYSLAEGPDVELDYYNFEALNFPVDHPSRDTQDTFYINEDILLRTQTSPVQVRYMERHTPPLRIIVPGRVYRNETPDPSHASEFLQMEGLYVDRNVSLADLRNDVTHFVRAFFGSDAKVRFRPHFFPFTEPSAEADMTCFVCRGAGCGVCGKTGWIEIGGAGMVHPHVYRYAGYDPDAYTGFAFGLGLDRLAMIKYGIDDIRRLMANDLRFLRQFWGETGVEVPE